MILVGCFGWGEGCSAVAVAAAVAAAAAVAVVAAGSSLAGSEMLLRPMGSSEREGRGRCEAGRQRRDGAACSVGGAVREQAGSTGVRQCVVWEGQ
jgi:hypothetical protein